MQKPDGEKKATVANEERCKSTEQGSTMDAVCGEQQRGQRVDGAWTAPAACYLIFKGNPVVFEPPKKKKQSQIALREISIVLLL